MNNDFDKSKHTFCTTCTIDLVELCYTRSWLFRLFREPLVWGMRLMARWYGIDPYSYNVGSEQCRGCIRFMKNALKERSRIFRAFNFMINPIFNAFRNAIVSREEIAQARKKARDSMQA